MTHDEIYDKFHQFPILGIELAKCMMNAVAPYRVKLLGEPRSLWLSDHSKFPAKGYLLLGLLHRSRDCRMRRSVAASILWDSNSDDQAFTNLRQLIARIRRSSPEKEILINEGQAIILAEPFRHSDLQAFEKMANSTHVEDQQKAVELFDGDLLEGCDEHMTTELMDWVIQERTKIRQKFFFCATSLLYNSTRLGRPNKPLIQSIAHKMLDLEPEREETFRTLIEVYGRAGLQTEARRAYENLQKMVQVEHGSELDPETVRVARKVFASAIVEISPEQKKGGCYQPRVAFLLPEWVVSVNNLPLFRALVGDVANELAKYRSFSILGPHTSLKVSHEFGVPNDNSILKADFSISGIVRVDGDRKVLNLRLARCDTAEIQWAAEFSFSAVDLYMSHRILVLRVVSSLASAIEQERTKHHKVMRIPDAYVGFISGLDSMAVCNLQNLRKARRLFNQSIGIDQTFASAHAGLARTLLFEWLLLGADSPEIVANARQCAKLALEIDPDDAQVISTAASVDLHQHDIPAALDQFAEAEALSPHSCELLVEYANALSMGGKPELGLEKFERAISLDPLQPDDRWWAGASIAFSDNQYERAISYCEMMHNDEAALRVLTASHAMAGNIDQAIASGQRLREIYPDQTCEEMVGIAPIKRRDVSIRFLEGLRLAGL